MGETVPPALGTEAPGLRVAEDEQEHPASKTHERQANRSKDQRRVSLRSARINTPERMTKNPARWWLNSLSILSARELALLRGGIVCSLTRPIIHKLATGDHRGQRVSAVQEFLVQRVICQGVRGDVVPGLD
jgi:hypothetical protein